MIEFLVHMVVHMPGDLTAGSRAELIAAESKRARELSAEGVLVRLWRIPGQTANWGLWRASNPTSLHAALSSLPLFPYSSLDVVTLARHPNDPSGISASE